MRLRDILMAWQQQGCPDPANFEVNLTQPSVQPQLQSQPQVGFAQLGQQIPGQPGAVQNPYPAQGQQLPQAPYSPWPQPPPAQFVPQQGQQLNPYGFPPQPPAQQGQQPSFVGPSAPSSSGPFPPFPQVGSPVGPATSPPPNPYANYPAVRDQAYVSRLPPPQGSGEPLTAEQIRFQQLEAQVKHERQLRRHAEASEFYRAQYASRKAVPSEEAQIEQAYEQAANDDDEYGFVTFANGQSASRVDQLRAQFEARPSHVLTQELVGASNQTRGVVLGPQVSDTQAIDAARSSAKAYAEQANGAGRRQA